MRLAIAVAAMLLAACGGNETETAQIPIETAPCDAVLEVDCSGGSAVARYYAPVTRELLAACVVPQGGYRPLCTDGAGGQPLLPLACIARTYPSCLP